MTPLGYLKIAICVGLLAVGFGTAWTYRGAQLDKERTINKVCVESNAENIKTITAQKAEIEKLDKSCSARISSKDRAIKKLKQIDELTGGKTDEKGNPGTDSNGDDDILRELNGMFKQADSKD